MAISLIEHKGSWYNVFNEQGRKTETLPDHIGELLGYGTHFFIVKHGSWYHLFDERGKKYHSLPESIGTVISITGDSFIARRSSWLSSSLDTYNSSGKKVSTRSVN